MKLSVDQLNVQDKYGNTTLCHAIFYGCIAIAEKLVDKLSIDQLMVENIVGYTPLDWAVSQGNTAIVQKLKNKLNKLNLI
ncbi:MAG: ankyrin repeat domain-containing protein [Candidatus Amoebophilus sp.]